MFIDPGVRVLVDAKGMLREYVRRTDKNIWHYQVVEMGNYHCRKHLSLESWAS